MPVALVENDMVFNTAGDICLSSSGDLLDTKTVGKTFGIAQRVRNLVRSEALDWANSPTYFTTINEAIGEPNTRENAKALEARLSMSIISELNILSNDFSVRAVPVSQEELLITITVKTFGGEITVKTLFDYAESGVLVV